MEGPITAIDEIIVGFIKEAQGDLSDKRLAKLAGIAQSSVSTMKALKKPFRTLHLARLIEALGMSPSAAFTAMARIAREFEEAKRAATQAPAYAAGRVTAKLAKKLRAAEERAKEREAEEAPPPKKRRAGAKKDDPKLQERPPSVPPER
jgi:hypothetical protein